jgi:hypothetical protein
VDRTRDLLTDALGWLGYRELNARRTHALDALRAPPLPRNALGEQALELATDAVRNASAISRREAVQH